MPDSLNSAQKKAASHRDGPILVLAGAGSGKTRVIAHRIGELVRSGVTPERILAVTFTNKAAKEMRERVERLLGSDRTTKLNGEPGPLVTTFHSLGVRILREHARRAGIPQRFRILDRGDSIRAVKDAIERAGWSGKEIEPRAILSAISKEKGRGTTLVAFRAREGNAYWKRVVTDVWIQYERILAEEEALDFDDLLLSTVELLRAHADIREYYQRAFEYLHVDEYQDTNAVQYELARTLAGERKNICAVGDLDQNIYSWRGATIENIINFERHFPGATIILLEENYRSTKVIVEASNQIIKKNKRRVDKTVFTTNADGERIGVYGAYDETDEARFVAHRAQELIAAGIEPRDIAVLYRANFQSRALEEQFLAENIPYQVLGVKFFERKEVKDMLALIRLALGHENLPDLKRVVNTPPRGIGKITFLKIAERKEETLPAAMRKKIAELRGIITRIGEAARRDKASGALKYALRESGIEAWLKDGGEDDRERLKNIRELVTLAARYDHMPAPSGMEKLIDEAALASDQDELKEETSAVRLMTVHAAKGLEFSYVFVTGLEDGLFPHEPTTDRTDDEEERRLFYVALTRARTKAYLTFASTRMIFGARQVHATSEFLNDIEPALLEEVRLATPRTEYLTIE